MSNSATKTASNTEGNKKTTATYSCDASGFGFSVITDDIRSDFNFLINEMSQKLDNAMAKINDAATIDDAFYFENGSVVNDLSVARDQIQTDISNLKRELSLLHSAFMTDIDNVNMELEYNFGWPIIGEVKKKSIRTETIEETKTES